MPERPHKCIQLVALLITSHIPEFPSLAESNYSKCIYSGDFQFTQRDVLKISRFGGKAVMESGHVILLVWGKINTRPGCVYLVLPAVNSSRGLKNRVRLPHRMAPFREFYAECTNIPDLCMPKKNSRRSPASFLSQKFPEHQHLSRALGNVGKMKMDETSSGQASIWEISSSLIICCHFKWIFFNYLF